MKLSYSWQIFEKYKYVKFHENPSSGSHPEDGIIKLLETSVTKTNHYHVICQ
jgi:hypothetical protein